MGLVAEGTKSSHAIRLRNALGNITYKRVASEKDRDDIFRLRYNAYLAEGAIDANASERFSDDYDNLDNCWIFGVYWHGELVSSLRFHVISKSSRRGPALDVFPDIVGPLIESGHTVVDPTRLVVAKDASRRHPELPYLTVRLACMASEYFKAAVCLATVRTEHEAFYRKLFDFTVACDPRPYPTLKRPIALMLGDMNRIRDHVSIRYPVFTSKKEEQENLFGREGSERFISATGLQLLNLPAAPLPLRIA